jgi:hypothetical protein
MKLYILILLSCILVSCSHKPICTHEVRFREPNGYGERLVYNVSKGTIGGWIHPASSSSLSHISGQNRLADLGREFFKDIGGKQIELISEDGCVIKGFYFDPKLFRQSEGLAYKKWRQKFNEPRNSKLTEVFEIDYNGQSIATLFSLPRTIQPLQEGKKKPIGILVLPTHGMVAELDPKAILSYLLRGLHVLSVNYRGVLPAGDLPDWKESSLDAKAALTWLKNELNASEKNLFVLGKSFGSGPAIFAATQLPGSNLIVDRGFARLSEVCEYEIPFPLTSLLTPFAKSLIEKYHRFPNEDWISKVEGETLIIEAREDFLMKDQGERLLKALARGKSAKEKMTLREDHFLHVPGGSFGKYWGESSSTWYSDEKSQIKVTSFLKRALVSVD